MSAFIVPTSILDLGQIVATPGVLEAVSHERRIACLALHARGDWGVVSPESFKANHAALFSGARILSAYAIDPTKPCYGFGDNCLWIITEADRSVTTFLLPSEY